MTGKTALVAIADGTEEMECCVLVDILRRAGVAVTIVSVTSKLQCTFAHNVIVVTILALKVDC